MIHIQDIGEVAYGGAVTLATWWDNKRIADAKIGPKDVLKKASFYTYLGVGLVATLMSVFGWMKRYETWAEKISTGFFYDLPRFLYNLSKDLGTASRSQTSSSAVQQAQKVLQQAQSARQLAGQQSAQRSYQPEFKSTTAW